MTPDNRMYCPLSDGRKIGMPRYYKLKMYTEEQRQQIGWATLQRMREQKERKIASDPQYFWNHEQKRYKSLRPRKDDKTTETL